MRLWHVLAGIVVGSCTLALTKRFLRKKYIEAGQPAALLVAAPLMITTLVGFLFEIAEYSLDQLYFHYPRTLGSPYSDIEGQLFNLLGAAVAVGIYFFYNAGMNKKTRIWIASIGGVVLLGLAFTYWIVPAGSLPQFLPGFIAGSATIHFKHGLGAFILALGAFALAWFQSGKKSAV